MKISKGEFKKLINEEVKKLQKIDLLKEEKSSIEKELKVLNEGDAFNDAGEPMMTHQQFNKHSEPAEPELDDRSDGDELKNPMEYFRSELEKNDIFLVPGCGDEYSIDSIDRAHDYLIYIKGNHIKIYFDGEVKFEGYLEDSHVAVEFLVGNKELFMPFNKSAANYDQDVKICAHDDYLTKTQGY